MTRPLSPRLACVVWSGLAAAACAPSGPPSKPLTRVVVAYPHGALDLLSHRTNDEISNAVLRHAYEPLVDFSSDLSLVPCLAESWYNPDELTWVFQLRSDVMRHDGARLSAEDVARYFAEAAADPRALRGVSDVTAVEAAPGNRVVFRTRRPIGWLPSLIARQLVSLPPQQPGEPPIGTGPWRVREWTSDGDTVLEAFDGHRDGRPAIERVEFRVLDPPRAVDALRRGEVHLMLDVPPEAWKDLQTAPGVETRAQPGLRVFYLMFNLLGESGGGPLGDRRVREAVARAIDREALLAGGPVSAGRPIRTLVPPAVFGHNPDARAPDEDRDLARRLLREAGYGDGLRLSLAVGDQAGNDRLARRLQGELASVGVSLDLVEGFPEAPRRLDPTWRVNMFLLGWLHSSGDVGASYEYLAHTPGRGATGSVSGYSNPEVDRLLAEAAQPLPMRDRRVRLLSVAALLQSEVAMVPLYQQTDRYAWRRPLRVRPRLDRRIRAQEMAWGEPLPASALLAPPAAAGDGRANE